jgi:hypothetical protein
MLFVGSEFGLTGDSGGPNFDVRFETLFGLVP